MHRLSLHDPPDAPAGGWSAFRLCWPVFYTGRHGPLNLTLPTTRGARHSIKETAATHGRPETYDQGAKACHTTQSSAPRADAITWRAATVRKWIVQQFASLRSMGGHPRWLGEDWGARESSSLTNTLSTQQIPIREAGGPDEEPRQPYFLPIGRRLKRWPYRDERMWCCDRCIFPAAKCGLLHARSES
jgi:hypothetical protein